MSFLTCFWLFPQKEHFSRSPPSPMRATGTTPHDSGRPRPGSAPGPQVSPRRTRLVGCLRLSFLELEGTPSRPQMGQDTATPAPGLREVAGHHAEVSAALRDSR